MRRVIVHIVSPVQVIYLLTYYSTKRTVFQAKEIYFFKEDALYGEIDIKIKKQLTKQRECSKMMRTQECDFRHCLQMRMILLFGRQND